MAMRCTTLTLASVTLTGVDWDDTPPLRICKAQKMRRPKERKPCDPELANYASMLCKACADIKGWRIAHPPRKRFQPPTLEKKSKGLLAESPSPELPEGEKVSMGMAWWLASPDKHEVTEWVEQDGYRAPTHMGKHLAELLSRLSAMINMHQAG